MTTDLIARLKEATRPGLDLDAAVCNATGGCARRIPWGRRGQYRWKRRYPDSGRWGVLPSYTTSLDDALRLFRKQLPGWDAIIEMPSGGDVVVCIDDTRDPDDQPDAVGRARTPALALCIAILTALVEGVTDA